MTTIEITSPIVKQVARLAQRTGHELYVVGGYVRNLFLGTDQDDIDFTIVGDALEFARICADEFGSHTVVYERFRTALVPIGHTKLEFVGTRLEEYQEHSRKPIVREGTLEDDLRRRDFTINAMAISLNKANYGELIDLFGGIVDLQQQLLRTPLDPFITFEDDPLRMMRAARFAAKLDFYLDDLARDAMREMAERVRIVSQERVTDEFLKLLSARKPSIGLAILYDCNLMQYVFPEVERLAGVDLVQSEGVAYKHKDVFRHTLQVLDNVARVSDNVWLRFATLMHDIAKPKTKKFIQGVGWSFHGHEEIGARWQSSIFRRMKLPMEHLSYVETIVRLHQRPMALADEIVTDSALRRLAVHAGDALDDLFLLCRADITTKNLRRAEQYLRNYEEVYRRVKEVLERDHLRAFQSPVRGEEIMEVCGIPPSYAVGYIKSQIEEAILDGLVANEYEAAFAYFMANKEQWLASVPSKPNKRRQMQD